MAFKNQIFISTVFTFIFVVFFCGVINIDGTYQGETVYVQNPISSDQSFCITEVYLNDIPFYEINSTAFEIPLDKMRKGQYVNIKIVHKNNCRPKILNTHVLRTKSTYQIVSFKVDEEHLRWTTKNEGNEEPFIVEKFRNNKWVEIGKIIGKGPEGFNNYIFDINHYSDVNKYRIKQRDLGNKYNFSESVEFTSTKPPITFYPKRVSTEIYLSEKAEYEIYDSYGSLILKGEGFEIRVSELESGVYYLNIDNRTEKFLKK